jgi:hypothetical protein
MRNNKIALRIQEVLAQHQLIPSGATSTRQTLILKLDRVRCIVDRRLDGERNWKVEEIAERENLGYMTVYRALRGRPGWFRYGRSIRVTDTLYRAWLTAVGLEISLDEYFTLPPAV